jgi:hypothetical protein
LFSTKNLKEMGEKKKSRHNKDLVSGRVFLIFPHESVLNNHHVD